MCERSVEELQEEQEFLRTYDASRWPHPSLTADICVFRLADDAPQVLLIRRGGHPYRGGWALPGGFTEPGEDIEQTAAREAAEETGLTGLQLERTYLYSGPGRDPRGWVASQVFVALVDDQVQAQAGDDAADACWFLIHAQQQSDGVTWELTATNAAPDDTNITLTIEAGIEELPYTTTRRTVEAQGRGLAFDHARLIADAYLFLEERLTSAYCTTE